MAERDAKRWTPFRPGAKDLQAIAEDVSAISEIQKKLLANHGGLHFPDRVAHQYQIAGSKVLLQVAEQLPEELQGVGLFCFGGYHHGRLLDLGGLEWPN